MKAKPLKVNPVPDMFRSELNSIINLQHELCRMTKLIDWERFELEFGKFFPSHTGNPAKSSRLVVGLFYLKHAYKLSDEELVLRWIENPYWQYFCGETYLQHDFPLDPSSLSRWRKRLKEKGCEMMLEEMIKAGLKTKVIKAKDLENVIADTTVQEKAVTYPTDSKLYYKAIKLLVKKSKKHGIILRQTYERVSKKALFKANQYFYARQTKRAKKQVKKLKTYLGRLYRDIQKKIAGDKNLEEIFKNLLFLINQLLQQTKEDKKKLYSLHAPEVECIGKGKVQKRYEFGVKVSVVSTHRKNFVLGIKALTGNPHDGHTLEGALNQVERLTGKRAKNCYVDRGYRGHQEKKTQVFISRMKTQVKSLMKSIKRRNAIEPLIGHMKSDSHLDRNYLKGRLGDKMNAILSGVGCNFRVILRMLRIFLLQFFILPQRILFFILDKISKIEKIPRTKDVVGSLPVEI